MSNVYKQLLITASLLMGLLTVAILPAMATGPEDGGGIIKGIVTTNDNTPAEMVTVTIKGTKKTALTEGNGAFVLRNVQPGTYELQLSLIGYETVTENVTVEADKITAVHVQLKISNKELQEVIVKTGVKSYKTNAASSSLRIQTPLLETPQNIQVVTSKALSDQQVISMSDGAIRNVSGAIRQEHWGDLYTNIVSRGSQIQAFRNGFNVVNSYWGPLTEDMSFVDHIEFVKGPAGFMLANGDPSGLYNVVTKKPTGQTKGEVTMTVGSWDMYRATLDLDGKLSKDDRLLYRLNVAAQNKKSFRANEFNNRYSIAPVVSYQLDENTKLTAEYTWQHANMSDVGSFYVFSTDGYATLPRNFSSLPAGLPATNIDDHSVFLNLQHQINSNWKFTSQAAYFNYQQNGSSLWPSTVNADGTWIRNVGSWQAKSKMTMFQAFVNGDVTTGPVRHRILAGLDMANKQYWADWGQYHDLDTDSTLFDTHNPYLGTPTNGYPQFDYSTPLEERATAIGGLQDSRYTGLYVQDELGFFDNKLRLTLAGRYTNISQAAWGGDAETAKRFTPRIGVSYSIDKSTAVYGLYDQAFIPQGGKITGGAKVQPITGSNVEAGIKKEWADGKWITTASIYRIIKNNELTTDPSQPATSGLSLELGQKVSEGVEFDLRGRIINGLSVIANYAYTNSKITKVTDGVTAYKVGDVVPGFATHTMNAWLNYKVQSGAVKGLGASLGFTAYIDRHTNDTWFDGMQKLPDYFKLDGGLFWEGNRVRITANVFNITDRYLYSGSYYSYIGAYYWQAEAPRNVRFSVAYSF